MLVYYVFIFLIIYMALMLFLGYYGARRVKVISDFTSALSSYGPLPVALAYAAVWSSAVTFVGVPGFIYGIGPPGALYSYVGVAGTMIAAALATYYFRHMIEKMKPLTLFEYLQKRFQNNAVPGLAALTYVIGILFFTASALTGGGQILSVLMDWPYQWGLLLTAGICLIYIYMGGTHGTTLTAIVQAVIMCTASIVIFLLGFVFLFDGGVNEVFARMTAQNEHFAASHITSPISSTFMLPSLIGIFLGHIAYAFSPHVAKTVLMLQDQRQVLYFLIWVTVILSVMILAVWAGAGARAYLADPNLPPDAALPTLLVTAFHPVVAALLSVAIFSAAMSSFGPMILVWSVTITHDLYRNIIMPKTSVKNMPRDVLDQKQLLFTRLLLILGTVISVAIVWNPPAYLILLMWAGFGAVIAGVAPVAMLSTMWRGVTVTGAVASNIAGIISFLTAFLVLKWTPFEAAGAAIVISFSVAVVGSLITNTPPKDYLDSIFARKQREFEA